MKPDILPTIFIDFETYWADDYTLSGMPTQAYIMDNRFRAHGVCIAIGKGPIVWVAHDIIPAFLGALTAKLPNAIWVAHNCLFDMTILSLRYGVHPKFIVDTAGMSRAILGPALKSHSLDSVAQYLLGEAKGEALAKSKNVEVLSEELSAEIAAYCSKDVELMRKIYYALIADLPASELQVMTWVTRMMTRPRVMLDQGKLEAYNAHVVAQKAKVLECVPIVDSDRVAYPELTDDQIRRKLLMSNALFAKLLTERGVMPPTKLNAKGDVAYAFAKTDPELKALLGHDDTEVASLVAARLEVKSTIEETRSRTYADLAQYPTVCVPLAYSGAVSTHRLSGRDTLNFQNLKRGGVIRESIIPRPGEAFIVSDLSQIELRITLYLSNHNDAVEFLASGGDLYASLASDLYGREIKKGRKEDEEQRHVGKEIVLGSGYGMGGAKLHSYLTAKGVDVMPDFAQAAIKLYRTTYAGVPRLWRAMERCFERLLRDQRPFEVAFGGYVCPFGFAPVTGAPGIRLPSGLWLRYPELHKDDDGQWGFASGGVQTRIFGGHFLENLVQALARVIMTDRSIRVDNVYPVCMSTHDELTAVVPEDNLEEAKQFVHDIMVGDVDWLPGLKLGSETKAGFSYGKIK